MKKIILLVIMVTMTELSFTQKNGHQKIDSLLYTSEKPAGKLKILKQKSIAFNNIGQIYFKQGNHPEALKNHLAALKIAEEIDDKDNMVSSFSGAGFDYFQLKKSSEAFRYLNQGLSLAKQTGNLKYVTECYLSLSKLDSIQGDFKRSLENYKMYVTFKDSLLNSENAKKTTEIQMQFAVDKKRLADSLSNEKEKLLREIAFRETLRTKSNQRNIFLFTGLAFLLLAGGLWSRLRYIRMSAAIINKEKERSEILLLNILPAEIARELKEKGKADAKHFEEVSVLFTDFEDFTRTSEKLSAQELLTEINVCFEAFDDIIGKYGIEKIKTIGDSYMAAGGLPVHFPESVTNTVKAGLEMQEFITRHKQERESQGYPAFEMRLGIHTGPIVAGIVGVKKFQYDIWGDTVNTAACMENKGEIRKVNISKSTFEFIKDDPGFCFEYRGKIEAKHKGELDMYFVLGTNQ